MLPPYIYCTCCRRGVLHGTVVSVGAAGMIVSLAAASSFEGEFAHDDRSLHSSARRHGVARTSGDSGCRLAHRGHSKSQSLAANTGVGTEKVHAVDWPPGLLPSGLCETCGMGAYCEMMAPRMIQDLDMARLCGIYHIHVLHLSTWWAIHDCAPRQASHMHVGTRLQSVHCSASQCMPRAVGHCAERLVNDRGRCSHSIAIPAPAWHDDPRSVAGHAFQERRALEMTCAFLALFYGTIS